MRSPASGGPGLGDLNLVPSLPERRVGLVVFTPAAVATLPVPAEPVTTRPCACEQSHAKACHPFPSAPDLLGWVKGAAVSLGRSLPMWPPAGHGWTAHGGCARSHLIPFWGLPCPQPRHACRMAQESDRTNPFSSVWLPFLVFKTFSLCLERLCLFKESTFVA